MKALLSRAVLLALFLTITGIMLTISKSSAQATTSGSDNITAMTDKYWADYESYIKKAVTEKDNHKSAVILNQMVKELVPRAAELKAKTAVWKNSHDQMEQLQLVGATQGNKHIMGAMKYYMDPGMAMRTGQNEELNKAFKSMTDKIPLTVNNTVDLKGQINTN